MEIVKRAQGAEFDFAKEQFYLELASEAESPPNDDQVIGAFNEASLIANRTIPAYRELTDEYIAAEAIEIPSYRAKKYFKCHQALLVPDRIRHSVGYPEKFTDKEVWLAYLTDAFQSKESPEYSELRHNLLTRALQTNRFERAKVIGFVATCQFQKQYFEDGVTVHEYGSSNNHITKALAMHMITDTTVIGADGNPDPSKTSNFNVLTRVAPFGRAIGIEARPPKTADDFHWLKSCSLDPIQFDRDGQKGTTEDSFDMLAAMKHRKITTARGDLVDMPPRIDDALRKHPADIAFLSHVLSQNTSEFDRIIRGILPRMQRRGGLIVVNEYAEVDASDPRKLRFLENWYSEGWLCRTLVMEVARPEEGFYPVFTWESAHCKRVKLEPGVERLTTLDLG